MLFVALDFRIRLVNRLLVGRSFDSRRWIGTPPRHWFCTVEFRMCIVGIGEERGGLDDWDGGRLFCRGGRQLSLLSSYNTSVKIVESITDYDALLIDCFRGLSCLLDG